MGTLSQLRMVVNRPVKVDKVALSFQGGLVVAKMTLSDPPERLRGGKRGVVSRFSAASRLRLLKLFSSMDIDNRLFACFITLTYPAEFPSPAVAKEHRRAFQERLKRFAPACSWVWRMEFQDRGAPHFHFVVFGLPFLDKLKVRQWWAEIIGIAPDADLFTRIEAIRSKKMLFGYVSKYVAKVPDGGFNLPAYLHDGEFVHPVTGEKSGSVGRYWGVGNSEKFPFSLLTMIEIPAAALSSFYSFRRGARHAYKGCSRRPGQGFSLFVSDAKNWLDYWFAVVCAAA